MPERFLGLRVISGDVHDYRPLDPPNPEDPRPCCVGLSWKPPSGRTEAARRMKEFSIFAVPVYEKEGHLVATETPRYTLLPDPKEDD